MLMSTSKLKWLVKRENFGYHAVLQKQQPPLVIRFNYSKLCSDVKSKINILIGLYLYALFKKAHKSY